MKENRIAHLKNELRQGNTECLREIFEKHGDYCIKNLIWKTTCTKEMAEDIFVDAILNFRDKLLEGKITFLTSTRSYIYTTCLNMYRSNQYQQGRFEKKKYDIESHLYDPGNNDYLSTTVQGEMESELAHLSTVSFAALDDKCKTILRLFYAYDYSMAEIAEKMGFANKDVAKTTKSRCFRKWSKLVETFKSKER